MTTTMTTTLTTALTTALTTVRIASATLIPAGLFRAGAATRMLAS